MRTGCMDARRFRIAWSMMRIGYFTSLCRGLLVYEEPRLLGEFVQLGNNVLSLNA